MIGIENKQDFESLLAEIEASGEDPMLFIREEVHENHRYPVSGDHRYRVKQNYVLQHHDKFCAKPYWNLNLTQIYIGLRSDQAR